MGTRDTDEDTESRTKDLTPADTNKTTLRFILPIPPSGPMRIRCEYPLPQTFMTTNLRDRAHGADIFPGASGLGLLHVPGDFPEEPESVLHRRGLVDVKQVARRRGNETVPHYRLPRHAFLLKGAPHGR